MSGFWTSKCGTKWYEMVLLEIFFSIRTLVKIGCRGRGAAAWGLEHTEGRASQRRRPHHAHRFPPRRLPDGCPRMANFERQGCDHSTANLACDNTSRNATRPQYDVTTRQRHTGPLATGMICTTAFPVAKRKKNSSFPSARSSLSSLPSAIRRRVSSFCIFVARPYPARIKGTNRTDTPARVGLVAGLAPRPRRIAAPGVPTDGLPCRERMRRAGSR
jgi:hypothetical protein